MKYRLIHRISLFSNAFIDETTFLFIRKARQPGRGFNCRGHFQHEAHPDVEWSDYLS